MRLVRLHFKAFSQGANIAADIKQGWCAGVTAVVSHRAGGYSPEGGISARQWALEAFQAIGDELDRINSKSNLDATEFLQKYLGSVNMREVENVCGEIHKAGFDGRGCKILLSLSSWFPLLGYASYMWNSTWAVNHVGYLVRAGTYMLIFDPNYGLGLFQINDDQPLTLDNLTSAIASLAWARSVSDYYLCYTKAIAVIDEDSMRLRVSVSMERRVEDMSQWARRFSGTSS